MPHPSSQTQTLPAALDLALFELLVHIETYSDPDCEAHWMTMGEAEVQQVALALIQDLTVNLNGKRLAGALLRLDSTEILYTRLNLSRSIDRCRPSAKPFCPPTGMSARP